MKIVLVPHWQKIRVLPTLYILTPLIGLLEDLRGGSRPPHTRARARAGPGSGEGEWRGAFAGVGGALFAADQSCVTASLLYFGNRIFSITVTDFIPEIESLIDSNWLPNLFPSRNNSSAFRYLFWLPPSQRKHRKIALRKFSSQTHTLWFILGNVQFRFQSIFLYYTNEIDVV